MANTGFHPEHLSEQSRKEIMRKIRVKYTHPSSERRLKVKVNQIVKKIVKPVTVPPKDDFDYTDEFMDQKRWEEQEFKPNVDNQIDWEAGKGTF